ncbi:hypothetical protein [Streptomyces sp. NPDC023838]|uniref:hypothetical protein n=1 Tax=Streptomyces sp. NPDC023838 TaxID=3154325 RepID=UPI0034069C22
MSMAALLVLSSCSGKEKESVPSLPGSLCWGEFTGSTVAPLLPTGKQAQVLMPDGPTFDVFRSRYRPSVACKVLVDGKEGFRAFAQRRSRGKGDDWASRGNSATRIAIGDEGFIWKTGVTSVILCERPDLPRGQDSALDKSERYVVLEINANKAPDNRKTRDVLASLMKQYVQFADRGLKCAKGA